MPAPTPREPGDDRYSPVAALIPAVAANGYGVFEHDLL